MKPTIDEVRDFWNANPLWTGDVAAKGEAGSREFFASNTKGILDGSGGAMPEAMFPVCLPGDPVLDLGCGPGFWLEQFGARGFTNLTGADLSERSLALAQERCRLSGIHAAFSVQNAEALTLPDESFAHVQCTGVIHHSPRPPASMREIWRVLRPGGRAVVSVYYRNILLRNWPLVRPFLSLVKLGGRGREGATSAPTVEEFVRMYDGADNPIGTAYSTSEAEEMIAPLDRWRRIATVHHYVPARFLPFRVPLAAVRAMQRIVPFMVCVVAEKR